MVPALTSHAMLLRGTPSAKGLQCCRAKCAAAGANRQRRHYGSATTFAIPGMEVTSVSAWGKSFHAYTCGEPANPGVVVLPERRGVTTQIQLQAQRIARHGYRCLIPDLYRGRLGVDAQEAERLMGSLDFRSAVNEIRAGASFLSAEGSKATGVTGCCMGGALSLAAAVRAEGNAESLHAGMSQGRYSDMGRTGVLSQGKLSDLGFLFSCVAPFYGIPDKKVFDYSTIQIPVQAHFGKLDAAKSAEGLEKALQDSGCEHEVYTYDGVAHGFMEAQPDIIERTNKSMSAGMAYSQKVCELAFTRLLIFFETHLQD